MSNLTAYLREHGMVGVETLKNNPFEEPLIKECRGLVLDAHDNFNVVAFPYVKFFNEKEIKYASSLDWTSPVRVYDKVDGSLVTLYQYKGEWFVATRGMADGSGSLPTAGSPVSENDDEITSNNVVDAAQAKEPSTFSELFWSVWNCRGYKLPGDMDSDKCFMFELVTPQNRVMHVSKVQYNEPEIYFHGVRRLSDYEEEFPDSYASKYGWRVVPYQSISNYSYFANNYLKSLQKADGLKMEGYVLCDSKFNRVKVKSPNYVRLALLAGENADGANWKRILSIVQENEGSEFLAYFPQLEPLYNEVKAKFDELMASVVSKFKEIKDLPSPIEFVPKVQAQPSWMHQVLFFMKKTGKTPAEFFAAADKHRALIPVLEKDFTH